MKAGASQSHSEQTSGKAKNENLSQVDRHYLPAGCAKALENCYGFPLLFNEYSSHVGYADAAQHQNDETG